MKTHVNIPEYMNTRNPLGINEIGNPYRVLVVDDSSTVRRLVGQMLRAEAFEVCGEASNGKEAIELYKELQPDLVTLDINMPLMSGEESLRRLLNYDKDARVVMITSEGHKELVVRLTKNGAKGYVIKPFKKNTLCEQVKAAIEG